jgi:hypothetical protein
MTTTTSSKIYYMYNPITHELNGSVLTTTSTPSATLPVNGTYIKPIMNNMQSMVNVFSTLNNTWTLVTKTYITESSPLSGNLVFKNVELNNNVIVTAGLTFATIPINTSFTANIELLNFEGQIRTDINENYMLYYYERETQYIFTLPLLFSEGKSSIVFSFSTSGIYDLVTLNLACIDHINSMDIGININKRKFVDLIYSTYGTVSVRLTALQVAELISNYISINNPMVKNTSVTMIASSIDKYIGAINIKQFSVYAS